VQAAGEVNWPRCRPGPRCHKARCRRLQCRLGSQGSSCGEGARCCGGFWLEVRTDPSNCGELCIDVLRDPSTVVPAGPAVPISCPVRIGAARAGSANVRVTAVGPWPAQRHVFFPCPGPGLRGQRRVPGGDVPTRAAEARQQLCVPRQHPAAPGVLPRRGVCVHN
jgi:hypothetical protein